MNITIKADTKDAALLQGFADATGWSERTGLTLEQWLQQDIGNYITRKARSGSRIAQTESAKEQYLVAIKAADELSRQTITPPVVTAGIAAP